MAPKKRFLVPDLSPEARQQLRDVDVRYVFVAESPHVSEIAPDRLEQRRPLCGVAGRAWWSMLGKILEKNPDTDTSLERLIGLCRSHRIAVMNAVQYPLDAGIAKSVPEAEPRLNLGFTKNPGSDFYKKRKDAPEVRDALKSLRDRLTHPSVSQIGIIPLGNDAEWFVNQALGKEEAARRVLLKIPHPSAWWRQRGFFREVAEQRLGQLLLAKPDEVKRLFSSPNAV